MIRLHRPRSIRSRLLLATVASVGVALIVLLVAFNVLFERRLSANATDQARARAAAELSVIDASGGAIDVREALDGATGDSPIWVFDGSRSSRNHGSQLSTARPRGSRQATRRRWTPASIGSSRSR